MKANMLLGHEAGFTHTFCYATNFKTAMSLQKLKFHKIAQENASKFEAYGIYPFREVGKENENTSIWLKKLDPISLV